MFEIIKDINELNELQQEFLIIDKSKGLDRINYFKTRCKRHSSKYEIWQALDIERIFKFFFPDEEKLKSKGKNDFEAQSLLNFDATIEIYKFMKDLDDESMEKLKYKGVGGLLFPFYRESFIMS